MDDFLRHLGILVTSEAAARALWQSHRFCRQTIDFDDFCQKALLKAIEHSDTFRGKTTAEILGWLRAIGRQLAGQLRRETRRPAEQELLNDIADQSPNATSEEAEIAEVCATYACWLFGALADLRPADRELMQCHYWKLESFANIARNLGLPRNTVTKRHGRIIHRLRALWQTEGSEKKRN
jgi:RNA polymerase sigma factor (sigma-70 family)